MNNRKEIEQLYDNLDLLKKDFNVQLNGIENDLKEFHKILINLTKKYPEHAELLEFIVFINDKLETNQTQYKQVISEVITKMIDYKKIILDGYTAVDSQILNILTDLEKGDLQIVKRESTKNYIDNKSIDTNSKDTKDKGWSTSFQDINYLKEIKWTVVSVLCILVVLSTLISPKEVKSIIDSIIPLAKSAQLTPSK